MFAGHLANALEILGRQFPGKLPGCFPATGLRHENAMLRNQNRAVLQVAAARHTPIGWWFTVARMRWWNGAAMTGEEAALLVAHLAASQQARGGARVAEYGLAVLALIVVPGAVLLYRLRRRRQRGVSRAGGPVGPLVGCVLAATLLLSPPHVAVADTTTSGQPAEQASGEPVPQPQQAPTKDTASDAAKADAPTEHRSPPTDEKPAEPPSMGLCSGQ